MKIFGYLRALVGETLAAWVFGLGLISTSITFLPSLGLPIPSPFAIRRTGMVAMLIGFVWANYNVYRKLEAQIVALNAALAARVPINREDDVDILRATLARLWAGNRNPIGRHIPAVIAGHELGWDEDRLNAAGFRAAGDFGNLHIGFDGRNFLLRHIPR